MQLRPLMRQVDWHDRFQQRGKVKPGGGSTDPRCYLLLSPSTGDISWRRPPSAPFLLDRPHYPGATPDSPQLLMNKVVDSRVRSV